MAEKNLNVRIINRNDTLANWNSIKPVLKKGEIAIASIDTHSPDGSIVPTCLIKVGDGTKTFDQLKFVAAPASDVYAWAKIENPTIAQLPANLKKAIEDLEAAVGSEGAVSEQIESKLTAAIEALDVDTWANEDGIKFVTAVGEVDGKISVTRRVLTAEDIPALATSKITGLDTKLTELTNAISKETSDRETAIGEEAEAREQADTALQTAINELTTTVGQNKTDATTGINEAKAAAKAAQDDVDALENVVDTLSGTVSSNKTAAETAVANEKSARESADAALESKINKLSTDIGNLSNVMNFVGSVDTLPAEDDATYKSGDVIAVSSTGKEYVYDTTKAAGQKWVEFGNTDANTSAIGTLQTRMDNAEEAIANRYTKAEVDQEIGALESSIGSIDTAYKAADETLTEDLGALTTRVTAAEADIDNLEEDVAANTAAIAQVKTTADAAATKAALDELTAVVNQKALQSDLANLTGTVGEHATTLGQHADRMDDIELTTSDHEGRISTLETDLPKKADKTALEGVDARVGVIEADYLKAADTYILNCGGASL